MRFPRAPRRRSSNPSTSQTEIEIERENVLITLLATGTAYPFIQGKTYGPPEDCYPDEGGDTEVESIEVLSIKCDEGTQVKEAYGFIVGKQPPNLTSFENDQIEEALSIQAYEDGEGAYETACEVAYDSWKEGRYH